MKKTIILLAFLAGTSFCRAQIVPAPTEKQTQSIDKLMAPHRKKVADILEADKSGQYKTYQTDMERLVREKDPARKKALADQLERNHYNFIKNAFTTAKINLTELKNQVAGILGHNKFQMDALGGISSESLLPPGPIPLRFDVELICPFSVFDDLVSQSLVTNCGGFANDCAISTTAITEFDGGCRSQGWTGDKVELPTGTFQKITVSGQFNAEAWGFAFAIGGFGKAESKIGVRLQGPGFDQLVIVKDIWCMAPVIWFKRYEFEATNFQAQGVFTGNFSGGNFFTAQVFNESFAISVPFVNASYADCSSTTYDFIRVVATN
ncbi:MAG: hypothetical protein IPL27_25260 [Lewinellaceae bacterium]|nr:hypothetical protein [Lewinellaceae bacterium]